MCGYRPHQGNTQSQMETEAPASVLTKGGGGLLLETVVTYALITSKIFLSPSALANALEP